MFMNMVLHELGSFGETGLLLMSVFLSNMERHDKSVQPHKEHGQSNLNEAAHAQTLKDCRDKSQLWVSTVCIVN